MSKNQKINLQNLVLSYIVVYPFPLFLELIHDIGVKSSIDYLRYIPNPIKFQAF